MRHNGKDEGAWLLKREKRKNVILSIMLVGLLAAVFALFRLSRQEPPSEQIDIAVINMGIQDIGELATVEYLYTDVGKFEDSAKWFGKEIPFSFMEKSFIVKWDGCIKAGVDISKVKAQVNDATKEIVVPIPKAEILSHEIDEESMETLNEKNGFFNKITLEDIREFDIASKKNMEQRAIENGILDRAFDNAKNLISTLISTEAADRLGYTITFKVIE